MRTKEFDTKRSRVALSLAAGAVTGAVLVVLYYLWGTAQILGVQYILDYGLGLSLQVFVAAFVIWGGGLIVFALPPWRLLHKLRWRHWLVAAVTGAVMTFLVDFGIDTCLFGLFSCAAISAGDSAGLTVVDSRLTPHGWWVAFQAALLLSVAGVVVALVIWRIAYRRVDDAPTLPIAGS